MLKLFDGATYTVSRNIVIRQEIFGGLLFDRLNFLIYRLTPKSYDLFSYFYRPAMDFKQIIDSLCIKQDELEKFIRFSLNHKFLVRANTQEEIIPSTKYQYTCAIDLLDGDAERCKPTASLVATLRAPTFVWWDITYLCNFSCTYCYSSAGIKSKDELSFESVCRILDELRNAGVFYVFFLGGEPLLRNDIFDILSYAQEIGLGTMITSNGWFIDRDTANKLYNTGVTIARVSIDGYQSSTHDRIRNKSGSWNKAADAVKHLVAANMPRVGISPTVMSENIEEMGDLIKWDYENGVKRFKSRHCARRGVEACCQSFPLSILCDLKTSSLFPKRAMT